MEEASANNHSAILVDWHRLDDDARSPGVQWACESEDLDVTLLAWLNPGSGVAPHVNDEVDVLLMVVGGAGEVTVEGVVHPLQAGEALLMPRGAARAIRCAGERFTYLSVHRRRRGLYPAIRKRQRGNGDTAPPPVPPLEPSDHAS